MLKSTILWRYRDSWGHERLRKVGLCGEWKVEITDNKEPILLFKISYTKLKAESKVVYTKHWLFSCLYKCSTESELVSECAWVPDTDLSVTIELPENNCEIIK